MRLSLVIPAFNEAHRIGETLRGVQAYLARQAYDSEVIVVDDGSTDGTAEAAAAFAGGAPALRCVRLPRNRGKGAAVRRGMLDEAAGDYRVFFDADASTPIDELEKLWPCFDAGADIVLGSRAIAGSEVQVHQSWPRETLGRINNVVLRALGITRFRDTQCGFKGFTRAACGVVFPRQTIERFSFDAELLYIAHKHGLRAVEVPVVWRNSPSTRLRMGRDAVRMLYDLLTIRLKDALGRYR